MGGLLFWGFFVNFIASILCKLFTFIHSGFHVYSYCYLRVYGGEEDFGLLSCASGRCKILLIR